MRKQGFHLLLWISMIAFFIVLWTEKIKETGEMQRLNEEVLASAEYREQKLCGDMIAFLQKTTSPGKYVGIYLLETKFGYQNKEFGWSKDTFEKRFTKWQKKDTWNSYLKMTEAIWNDVKYFPVPESTSKDKLSVSYGNSWMSERTYGGERGHEGTDLIAERNERGVYPILSMTDGVVEKKGWLEKGGYRIGIKSRKGAYFYYAHLDSYANLHVGDEVKAGDILGFMGDSGYGPEGTRGKFAVHLHLGIYIYPNEIETSVNPYWVLRYLENKKVKCYTKI